MKNLILHVSEGDSNFLILAQKEENYKNSGDTKIKLAEFLEKNAPELYYQLAREIMTRQLAKDFSSSQLIDLLSVACRAYRNGAKGNSYNNIQEAARRKEAEEQSKIPF
jgi:hypothetical protein